MTKIRMQPLKTIFKRVVVLSALALFVPATLTYLDLPATRSFKTRSTKTNHVGAAGYCTRSRTGLRSASTNAQLVTEFTNRHAPLEKAKGSPWSAAPFLSAQVSQFTKIIDQNQQITVALLVCCQSMLTSRSKTASRNLTHYRLRKPQRCSLQHRRERHKGDIGSRLHQLVSNGQKRLTHCCLHVRS